MTMDQHAPSSPVSCTASPRRRLAVVLLNLGGPDAPESIRPFLVNLFTDPAILRVPGWVRPWLGRLIAWRRTKPATENYAFLGGKSLLRELTEAQALAVEAALNQDGDAEVKSFVAMRYWHPMSDETARAVKAWAPGARGASVYTLGAGSDPLAVALARRENLADRAGGLRLPSVPPEVQAILLSLMRAETRARSARMARQVVAELGQDVPLLPNTHRQAGFVVLKAPDIPSVLVEMGFLSSPQEEAALRRPEHRARIARGLARAIHGWLARAGQPEALAAG